MPLTCAGHQPTLSQGSRYRPESENLHKLGWTYCHGTVFHQGNIYIKRKIRVWRDHKCVRLVGAKISLTCAGRQTIPSQGRRYRVENGNMRKLRWSDRHATVFVPRQSLYEKEATGMERPEMYSSSWCQNPIYLFGPSNYHVSRESV